ncbi:MAG: hypothetical protein GC184_14665 [Rhizobiales bacterium]|nr:hypothetical protein [Hyphomicrobiales bacterium]
MPLTADRDTAAREGSGVSHPVKAATKIFAGALVCLDAAGWAVPGSAATTLKAVGRAEERVDNSAGANGDLTIQIKRGVFRFKNSGTDAIDRSDIGATAYVQDDETVAATDGTGTLSAAGKIIDLDAAGVWVEIR